MRGLWILPLCCLTSCVVPHDVPYATASYSYSPHSPHGGGNPSDPRPYYYPRPIPPPAGQDNTGRRSELENPDPRSLPPPDISSGDLEPPPSPVQEEETKTHIDVAITASSRQSLYPVFEGRTNLPDGAMLAFEMFCPHATSRNCYGVQTDIQVSDGRFRTEQLSRALQPGPYRVRLTLYPSRQSADVQERIGDHGQKLKGRFVKTSGEGSILQYETLLSAGVED